MIISETKNAIYQYIIAFEHSNGYCPSARDIKAADLGVSSISTISFYINDLIRDGKLLRPYQKSRIMLPHDRKSV